MKNNWEAVAVVCLELSWGCWCLQQLGNRSLLCGWGNGCIQSLYACILCSLFTVFCLEEPWGLLYSTLLTSKCPWCVSSWAAFLLTLNCKLWFVFLNVFPPVCPEPDQHVPAQSVSGSSHLWVMLIIAERQHMEELTCCFPCAITNVKQMYRNQLLTSLSAWDCKRGNLISKRKPETGYLLFSVG